MEKGTGGERKRLNGKVLRLVGVQRWGENDIPICRHWPKDSPRLFPSLFSMLNSRSVTALVVNHLMLSMLVSISSNKKTKPRFSGTTKRRRVSNLLCHRGQYSVYFTLMGMGKKNYTFET